MFATRGVLLLHLRSADEHSSQSERHDRGAEPTITVPGEITAMTLMLGLRPVGALGWRPAILSHKVATAVSAQVAIALTRALAIEATARLEASREGERLRSALIDSLTHELRTPLTSIRAAATTLMQGEGLDDAVRLDLASIVDEEASRLDALIGEQSRWLRLTRTLYRCARSHTISAHFWTKRWRIRRLHWPIIALSLPSRSRTIQPGSILTCWAASSVICWRMQPVFFAGQPHRAPQPAGWRPVGVQRGRRRLRYRRRRSALDF